jgi:hypothetical protein
MWTLLLVSFLTGVVLGISSQLTYLLLRSAQQEARFA